MRPRKRLKKLPGWAALVLSLALALLFSAAVLLTVHQGRVPGTGTVLPAVRAEQVQMLAGSDGGTRAPSEFLPEETIDLNSATVEELQRLDGIGPALAQAIVDYREQNGPFASVEELLEVPGIGEKKLAAIRDLVCADPPPGDAAAAAGG